jgi:serine/threonine-protein kinase RsbW
LNDVLLWFDQFNCPPIPFETWYLCQTVLAEGFTNAVRHAHHSQPDLLIHLKVVLSADRLEMRIWDQGAPFDLKAALNRLPPQIDLEAEGGRGLPLMQRICDHLSYTRTDDHRNCLLMVKHFLPNQSFSAATMESNLKEN